MPHHHHQHSSAAASPSTAAVTEYPEALPSFLTGKYTGPVMGTVIIGRELPEDIRDDEVFELVAPDGTVLNRTHASARSMLQNITASLNQMSAMPSFQSNASTSLTQSAGTPPSTPPAAPVGPAAEPSEKHILHEGGFVIFSDLYIAAHPSSPIAAITHDYERAAHADPQQVFTADPTLKEDKQRVERIKHLLKEADAYHRPLFRRRPSRLRYGAASYIPVEDSAMPSSGLDEERELDSAIREGDSFSSVQATQSASTFGSYLARAQLTPAQVFPQPHTTTRKPSRITVADSVVPRVAY